MNQKIACCGLNCEACDAYKATQTDDNELRQRVARLWSELNGVEITPEMISCDGCREKGRKTPFCEALCEIRRCAGEQNRETCGSCGEKRTCEKLKMITGTSEEARKNLDF